MLPDKEYKNYLSSAIVILYFKYKNLSVECKYFIMEVAKGWTVFDCVTKYFKKEQWIRRILKIISMVSDS